MASIAKIVNGVVRMVTTSPQYNQTVAVPVGGYASGLTLTLPASGTYLSADLQVLLDGTLLELGQDYNYVGSGTRTQITLLVDLFEGERLMYRVDSY